MFELIDDKIVIDPAILNIPEFKALWRRDKNRAKHKAYAELSYIYYVTDFKSPYRNFPMTERMERVRDEFCKKALGDDWKPDAKVQEAKEKYELLSVTPSLKYLESVEAQLHKVTNFLNGTVIDEETIKVIVDSVDKFNKVVLGLPKLKEAVQKEVSENSKIRGGGDVGLYEN
jgi:hypothetical protein